VVVELDFAVTPVGVSGAPTVTAVAPAAAGLEPRLFVATTLHVYVFAVVKAVTAIATAVAPVCTALLSAPPFDDEHVAVNFVIAAPLFAPAAYETVSVPVAVVVKPEVTVTPLGLTGVPAVTALEAGDAGLVPFAFLAATLNAYAVPFVSPVTTPLVAVAANVWAVCATPARKGVTT
jgi:hypothetical protein